MGFAGFCGQPEQFPQPQAVRYRSHRCIYLFNRANGRSIDEKPAVDRMPEGFSDSVAAQNQVWERPIRQRRGSSPKGAGAFSVHFCAYKSEPQGPGPGRPRRKAPGARRQAHPPCIGWPYRPGRCKGRQKRSPPPGRGGGGKRTGITPGCPPAGGRQPGPGGPQAPWALRAREAASPPRAGTRPGCRRPRRLAELPDPVRWTPSCRP